VRITRKLMQMLVVMGIAVNAHALQPQRGWLMNVYYLDGSLDLKPSYSFSNPEYYDDYDLLQMGMGFGYAFANGITTEMKINTGALDFFWDLFGVDTYRISEIHLAAAYDLYLSSRFSLGPEVRLTKVVLKAEEGPLFNPGPEEEYRFDQYAWTWGARAKLRASDRFTLVLSYYRADYDFGDTKAAGLQFQWHFN
jgi:hypothetical protein